VFDAPGGSCAIIDPVLDYDPKADRTKTVSADKLIAFIQVRRLTISWILETHAHADHLSSTHYLKGKRAGKTAIGDHIPIVQQTFKQLFNMEPQFTPGGT
jgi:glyoxylase-like metal-dependent hydrolase (beta-lactamase superfamily II)